MNRSCKRTTVVCFCNRDLKEWEVLVGNFFFFFCRAGITWIPVSFLIWNITYATRYRETWKLYWTLESWGMEYKQFPLEKKSLKSEQSQPMFSICNRVKHLLFQMISLEQASLISIISMITCGFLSKIRLDHGFSNGGTQTRPFQVVREAIISCTQNIIIIINHVNKIQSDYYSSWNRRSWYFWLKWDN